MAYIRIGLATWVNLARVARVSVLEQSDGKFSVLFASDTGSTLSSIAGFATREEATERVHMILSGSYVWQSAP